MNRKTPDENRATIPDVNIKDQKWKRWKPKSELDVDRLEKYDVPLGYKKKAVK